MYVFSIINKCMYCIVYNTLRNSVASEIGSGGLGVGGWGVDLS